MNFYNKLTLRAKLLGLCIMTLLIAAGGAWYSLEKISARYTEATYQKFETYARAISSGVAAQFYERYGDVQAFAVNETVKSGSPKDIQIILDQYVSLYGIYDLILVVDKNGHFVASNSADASAKKVNQDALKEFDFSNEHWFKAVLSGQTTDDKSKNFAGTYFEDFIDDPTMKLAVGEQRFGSSFSAPIKNSKGEVIGVVTNRAGERWLGVVLKELVEAAKEDGFHAAEFFIVNKEGLVIQHEYTASNQSEKDTLVRNLVKEDYDLIKKAQESRTAHSGERYDPSDKADDVMASDFVDGSKWIASIGWTTLVMDPAKDALLAVTSARHGFMILMAVACIFALTLSVWFSVVLSKSLNQVTNSLNENSSEVNEASVRIASQATQLSESATEQAAALQETMSAVDEISAMVEKNAEAAGRSKEVSANSKEAAERGRNIVDQMLSAIGEIDSTNSEISQQMDQSNRDLSEITKLISDIGTKTKVINEIVFQTKLLSFNASVEAARAGEYGKGFSVVAEEVGNLAQMSGNAAKEITSLLEESVRKVEQIVHDSKSRVEKMMNVSKEKVDQGSRTAKDCNQALEEILSNVESVDSLVSEIALASQEQSTGIKEISKAVGQMEQVTQQNSSVAQSSSVAAEQLRQQAAGLNAIVQSLVKNVNGSGAVATAESHAPTDDKVVKINRKPKKAESAEHQPMVQRKKASGSDVVPSSDDPGFSE